jgi:hypothetical protein
MNPRKLSGEHYLREEFGGKDGILLPPEFLYVECNEGCAGGQQNIDELKQWLTRIVQEDDSFRQRSIATWFRSQTDLAAIAGGAASRPYMPWNEFTRFCAQRGIQEEEEARRFARHQYEVGRLVWVDRGAMADNVILSPDWLSKALGYIVRARSGEDFAEAAGLIGQDRITAIWRNPQLQAEDGIPEPPMPEEMFPAFYAFMEEYDMAHPIDQKDGARRYLIPQRFLPNPPRRWGDLEKEIEESGAMLCRRIDIKGYDRKRGLNRWLLRAFFFRLIVRFHSYLVGREDPAGSANWEQGFCIEEPYSGMAQVECRDYHLDIKAFGPMPERLWWLVETAVKELRDRLKDATRTDIEMETLVPCGGQCKRPPAQWGFFLEDVVKKAYAKAVPTLGCKVPDCDEQLSVNELYRGVARVERAISPDRTQERILQGIEGMRREQSRILKEMQKERVLAQASRRVLEDGLANISSILSDHVMALDDPSRAGPCLFLIVPRDPDFLKDRGRMFGAQFRLHLFCERLLLPVSCLRGTQDAGFFDFEMTHDFWNKAGPYLTALGRLLSVLTSATGLLKGFGGGQLSVLARPAEETANDIQELARNAEKLLEAGASFVREAPSEAVVWSESEECAMFQKPRQAQGRELVWLHEFLKKQCETEDLTTAHKLGLRRILDKTRNRYLWVHPSQA